MQTAWLLSKSSKAAVISVSSQFLIRKQACRQLKHTAAYFKQAIINMQQQHAIKVECQASPTMLLAPTAAAPDALPPNSNEPAAPVWTSLQGIPAQELTLDHCLPTGQSFRWHQHGPGLYTGVIGLRLVHMRQDKEGIFYQVLARGNGALPEDDDSAIREYFNLPRGQEEGAQLAVLGKAWAAACSRYAQIQPHLPGARMLRQDPVECLFQFICSQNNHISRIHGMVNRLCVMYGTPLEPLSPLPPLPSVGQSPAAAAAAAAVQQAGSVSRKRKRAGSSTPAMAVDATLQLASPLTEASQEAALQPPISPDSNSSLQAAHQMVDHAEDTHTSGVAFDDTLMLTPGKRRSRGSKKASSEGLTATGASVDTGSPQAGTVQHQYYAFPTLDQLSKATEEELRAAGFGYRAKFIVAAVQQLQQQPGGGAAWLLGLRQVSYEEAAMSLSELPGVGPKVAACVCLFSLDKHCAVPVDTHVWHIATKYYLPGLKGKSLTKKVHADVQAAFEQRFGPYAGWAHNAMFIAELPAHKQRIG